jgi:uncharacterized membrane protein/rubredoxin
MTKRWECSVCGYIHEGSEPPESCPICSADRSKFILLDTEKSSLFHEMISVFKLHPVLAHFPSGLIPTAAFFLVVYVATGKSDFEVAAFLLVVFATIIVPFSAWSGIHNWYKYLSARRAPVFYKKLGLALTLFTLGLIAITIRYNQPALLRTDDWCRWFYLFCIIGMLGCVGLLGHYGSVLAAQAVQKQERSVSKTKAE